MGTGIAVTCNDYPKGVGSSDPKRGAPKGEDIVSSAVKAAAANERV